jgi:hypothetical protein
MATTQNNFTGDGSTVLFSFTFPYLETTDIKVTLNGVITTAYTLANATTIQFTTAPANGVAIRIFRQTDDSNLQSTFFPGSAIRSEDLNDNFTQNLYVTQEVNNNAVDIDGSNPMVGNLNANNFKVINLATPTADTDAANRGYVNSIVANGIGDGDKGDIVVSGSGSVLSIDAGVIVDDDVNPSAGIVSTKLSFTQAGSGATARTVDSKLKDIISVKDFIPAGVDTSTTDCSSYFEAAALAATWRAVEVPNGSYLLSSPTTTPAVWLLSAGALILPVSTDVPPPTGSLQDTSKLAGNVFHLNGKQGQPQSPTVVLGSSNRWLSKTWKYTSEFASKLAVSSEAGAYSAYFSSLNAPGGSFAIGAGFSGVNNNHTTQTGAWSAYAEGIRSGSVGGSQCGSVINLEMDLINLGDTKSVSPDNAFSSGITAGLWLSCGGGTSAPYGGTGNDCSVAIGVIKNPDSYARGLVFRKDSIDTLANINVATIYDGYTGIDEAISTSVGSGWAWYYPNSAFGFDRVCSFLDHYRSVRRLNTSTTPEFIEDRNIRIISTGSTGVDQPIYRARYYGAQSSGSVEFKGAETKVNQKTAFSSGNARFLYAIECNNDGAGTTGLMVNGFAERTVTPLTDNTTTLGNFSARWSVIWAGTGTISTSDERDKQDIETLSQPELNVASAIKGLIRKFRFKDAVIAKDDGARIHVGVVVQDVIAAFEAEGLDPMRYGIVCYDEWEAQYDAEGNETLQAGNRYGVRYEELLAFVIAAL